jgi:hypothetical protein
LGSRNIPRPDPFLDQERVKGAKIMRTLIIAAGLAAVGLTIPAAAQAQTWRDRQEYREDVRDAYRDYNRDLRRADDRGDVREARRDLRRDLREARRDYRRDNRGRWFYWQNGRRHYRDNRGW